MAPCRQSHPPLVQAPRRDLNCMLVSWGVPSLRQWFLKVIVTGPDLHFGNNQSLFFFSWGSETWVYTKSTQLSKSTHNIKTTYIYIYIPLPLLPPESGSVSKTINIPRILCPKLQVALGAGGMCCLFMGFSSCASLTRYRQVLHDSVTWHFNMFQRKGWEAFSEWQDKKWMWVKMEDLGDHRC